MKQLKKVLSIIMLISSACIIEGMGASQSFLINESNHQIKVIPYLNGLEQADAIKVVNPHETQMVFQMHERLKTMKPNYADILLLTYDSVKVVYDDQFAVWHLKTAAKYPKEVSFDNTRNIMNTKNYVLILEKETNHSIAGHFNFTFTEQDFVYASQ
jgi:hypothetical protein